MRITFDDKSFVEIAISDNPGKIIITISAKDHHDPLKKINNSCELTTEEFKKIILEVV